MTKDQITKLKSKYMEKEETQVDKLKALDRKARKNATVFAYSFGSIGTLVLGTGMCLCMEVLGSFMVLGIIIGFFGIAMVSFNYKIYCKMLKSGKAKYGKEIIELSDSLLNNI